MVATVSHLDYYLCASFHLPQNQFCGTFARGQPFPIQGVTINLVKVRDLVRLLESNGWRLRATKGSHRQFLHPAKGMIVTVPGQLGKDIPIGTLRAILRSANLETEDEDR
jgi:predicted RNA binding protein YcfA (HicA-like mRNA interferase family)